MEHHGVLEPTTAVVLKATNSNNFATAKTLNELDVHQTYTPVPA